MDSTNYPYNPMSILSMKMTMQRTCQVVRCIVHYFSNVSDQMSKWILNHDAECIVNFSLRYNKLPFPGSSRLFKFGRQGGIMIGSGSVQGKIKSFEIIKPETFSPKLYSSLDKNFFDEDFSGIG